MCVYSGDKNLWLLHKINVIIQSKESDWKKMNYNINKHKWKMLYFANSLKVFSFTMSLLDSAGICRFGTVNKYKGQFWKISIWQISLMNQCHRKFYFPKTRSTLARQKSDSRLKLDFSFNCRFQLSFIFIIIFLCFQGLHILHCFSI